MDVSIGVGDVLADDFGVPRADTQGEQGGGVRGGGGGQGGGEDMVANGLVRAAKLVKVLGTGELSVKFDVTADAFSASAKEKIEAAGGSVTER